MDHATLSKITVAGDFMVTGRVQPGHRHAYPLTTINSQSHTLDQRDRFHGIVRARQALKLIRIGSDSRLETLPRVTVHDLRTGFARIVDALLPLLL